MKDLQAYLKKTHLINWDNSAILEKASALADGLVNDVEKAKCLFEWVRDSIPHSKDIGADVVPLRASEVLAEGTGVCYTKTILLAALLRAVEIPCGFCYQIVCPDPSSEKNVLHALNCIYLESIDKWIRVDSRGNTGNFNGQFDIENEHLVFPENSEGSILIYDEFFTDPHPVVIETLTRFDSCVEMLRYLPEKL